MNPDRGDEASRPHFSYARDDSSGPDEDIVYVELRPHEFGGPFWDREGCLGDDWPLWQSLGLSRATFDACLRWTGDEQEKRRLLTAMRRELPRRIVVEPSR